MSINLIFSNSFLNFGVSGTKVSYQEMCSGKIVKIIPFRDILLVYHKDKSELHVTDKVRPLSKSPC